MPPPRPEIPLSLRPYREPTHLPLTDDELFRLSRMLGEACSILSHDDEPAGRMLYQSVLAAWSGCGILQDVRAGCSVSAEADVQRFHQYSILEAVQ